MTKKKKQKLSSAQSKKAKGSRQKRKSKKADLPGPSATEELQSSLSPQGQRRIQDKKGIKAAQAKKKQGASEETDASASEVTLDKTPMRIYLQQIESIPLLTPDDEVDVAKKIASGTRGSKEARARMIQSNLRLVISIAKRYANMGLPFSDLVEEGNIGLMRAVDKFNYERGYRFSTYASWWIKQAIMRALSNQGKTIRVPVYMYDTISKYRKVREGLIQKNSRVPTRKEIADAMELPISKIKELERIVTQPSSLNAPLSLDTSAEVMDLVQDENSTSPGSTIEELFETERIDQLLNLVDERERQILVLRFGLRGHETHTLEETAKQFGVTRERIRQIEMAAIKKIRYVLQLKEEKLEDYVR